MNKSSALRNQIRDYLKLDQVEVPVPFEVHETYSFDGYRRHRISYRAADGDSIPAFLWIPDSAGPFPAVLVHHQHNSQRYLGKSEVAGLAGDPLQAFGPALAERGFVVLAPDSICFEERRKFGSGITPHERDDVQHFIEASNRLTLGDTLMRKVLADASSAVSLLAHHPLVDRNNIGVCGHSYGGNTVLFQNALDPRISFAVSSGALCSYGYKRAYDTPLELALVIPGFAERWDMEDLLACSAPRPLLIVSAENDQYAKDAPEVIGRAQPNDHITHYREAGEHALTARRFERIISFLEAQPG